jgi:hypothetical protein
MPIAVMCVKKYKRKDHLVIKAFNEAATMRFTLHGFGYFLKEIKPGELLVSQAVVDTVKKGKYRSGVCTMEIFDGNIIGFCGQWVPLNELSVHEGAAKWFVQCCVVNDAEVIKEMGKKS